jgi:uncharacterized protein (TIGR03083 family)
VTNPTAWGDMDHLDGWRDVTARFADLLDSADLDATVPACPGWDVADLAYHVGYVLDRFRRIAGDRLTEKDQIRELGVIERPADDAELPAWFRARFAEMDPVLAHLDPSEPVWNFTRAPHDGAWVLRRMHHEMVVHLHDLEEAVGGGTSPIPDAVAADGVAEFMGVLSSAGKRWEADRGATIQVTEAVSGRTWRLRLDPGERAKVDDISEGAGDVVLRGSGAPLLLALWRRRPLDTVAMTGDEVLAGELLAALGR